MANNQGRIGFSIDFKKGDQSGLRELRTQLEQLQQLTVKEVINTGNLEQANQKLETIQGTAKKVQQALEDSYNAKLDTTDLNKFQKSLQSQGLTLKSIKDDFAQAGIQGQIAFRNLNTELLTTSRYTKQTSEWLDKMANTLGNTVRWSIASTAVNSVTGSIQKAYSYTKQLDSSLNDIRIVTEKSSEEMDKFARKANEAAKALGATTTDYTKASLIYYQQGLSDQEVAARANVTTKVANVTGVSADTASEQLTAIWNGYKVSAQEAELYIDKVSAVAATTAADLEELSIGMSKVASAANIMGVDIDQLNAQLATIVSVTREAPESIGTALKTVYARMSDIEDGLDSETTLGEYTEQMAQMGINALDAKGNLRDMGEVVEEIGDKWATLNRNQQTSLAQTIAGTRQYSRMMALFDNWDMYQQSKATSEGAAGALEKQNEIYLDSMEANLNQLSAATEGLYDSLLDPESLNKIIDGFTKLVGLVDQVVQSLGGGGNLLMTIGAIGFNVFDKQISRGISSTIRNAEGLVSNLKNANAQAEFFTELMSTLGDDDKYKDIVSQAEKLYQINSLMTDEEKKQADLLIKRSVELVNQESLLKEQKEQIEKLYTAFDSEGKSIDIGKAENAKDVTDTFKSKLQDADLLLSELGGTSVLNDLLETNAAVVAVRKSVGGQRSAVTRAQKAAPTPLEDAAREGKYVAQEEYPLIGHEVELNEKVIAAKEKLDEKQQTLNNLQADQTKLLKEYYNSIVEGNKDYASSLDIFEKSGLFNEDEINSLKEAEKLFTEIKKSKNETLDEKQIQDVAKATEAWNKATEKTKAALKEGSEQAEKLSKKLSDIKSTSDKASDSLKKFINSFQISKAVDGVVQLAGGLANVGTAASSIKNLGNIWSDESLTSGEKLLQTLSNVSFTIPMVVSGIKNLAEGWSSVGASIKNFVAVQKQAEIATQAYNAVQTASQSQLENRAFWDIIAKAAKEELTEEEWEGVSAILATEGALSAEQIAKLKSVLGDGAKLGSQKALSVAIKDTTKNLLEQTAAFLTSPAGMILLGVAAAVAAVTIAVKVGSEAYNKYNLKMEEASKAAEHQAQVYQDVKKAYEDLKASIENYEGAQKAIDEMTEGTEEWRDAIIEANKEVTELIEKYPQLAKYLNRDENNRLTLDSEGLKAAQFEASKASDLAYSQSIGANAALAVVKSNAKAETIAKNSDYTNFGTVVGGLFKNAIISPITTISEAIIKKDLLSVYENESSTDDILAIAQALNTEEGAAKDFRQLIEDTLEGESKAQVDALEENSDEIRALAEQLKNTADAEKELSASIMDAYLRGTSSDYRESEYQAQISAIAGNAYDEALERAQAKFADNGIKGSTYTDAQIQQMYADMMVETGQWQSVQHVSNKSGNKGKYTYIDASGNQQSGIEIDDIVARQALAVYEAQKEAGGDLSEITDIFEKVLISGNEKVDKQLANMLAGRKVDLNALNASEKALFQELYEDIKLTNEEIAQLGKETIDTVKQTAIDAFTTFENDLKEFIGNMNSDSKNRYNNIMESVFANSQLTSGAELALAQMYGSNNTIIIDIFEKLAEKFGENTDDFLNLLPGLSSGQDLENWKTAIYGETEFREILNDNLFKALVSELETTFDLYDAYSKKASQESFAYLKSLTSKVSQWGDVISAEDFDKLPTELKTYFTEMADGTAVLTEEADKYIEKTNELAQQSLVDDVIRTRDALADLIGQRRTVASENEAYEEKIKSLPDKAAEVDYVGQLREVLAGHGSTTSVLTAPFLINKNDKEVNAEYTEYARQMLGWLSDTIAPGTDKHFIDIMREKGVDVGYWYKKIVTDERITEQILQGLQIGIQQANAQIEAAITSNMPTKTKAELETEIEAAEADYAAAQKALLAGAGTKENFDYFKKEGYFEGFDSTILAEYEEFYNNQEKKFQQLADLSYKLTQSGRDIVKLNKDIEKYSEDFDKAFSDDKIAALDNLDRAFGDLDTTLNQDLGTLEKIRKRELEDFSQFDQVLTQFGIDVKEVRTDENGEILNYDSLIRKGTEFAKKNGYSPERMEELYAAFNRYYGLLDDVNNKEEEIEENKQNWYENDVKRFDTLLQNQLDYTEAQRQYNDFLREMADEDDYSVLAQSYLDDYLFAQQDILSVKQQIEKVNSSALNEADRQAKLIELQAQLQEKMLTAKEAYNQLLEFETESMESISDSYDQIVSVVEQLMDIEENRFKIHQLMGASLEDEVAFYQKQIIAQNNVLNKRKEEYEYWRNMYNDTTVSDERREEARRKMLESGQEIASLSATLAQAVADNLERSVDLMMEKTFGALEELKEEYDWLVKDSDRSYDKITGMFRVSELESMIEREKAQNASISAQRKLNDFLEEEIKVLRKKDKLTEYDYERAKARFELLQAQIALEEAQANKTTMRLVRGADGSYSYQYVADTNAIAEKEQDVLSAQEAVMQLDREEVQEYYEGIYDTVQDFIDRFKKLFTDDNFLSEEDVALLTPIWDSLLEQLGDVDTISEKLKSSIRESAKALGIEDFNNLSDEQMKELFPWMDSGMYTAIRSFMGGTTALTKDTFVDLIAKANATGEASGIQGLFDFLGADFTATMNNAGEDTKVGLAGELENLKSTVSTIDQTIKPLAEQFGNLKTAIMAFIDGLHESNILAYDGEGYDTGGYTGAWGASGKLAVLHEKELVLNKEDTPNILSAVEIVRNLSADLDLSMMNRLAEMMKSYDSSMIAWEAAKDWVIEQQVNIQAEFPNVTEKSEIEEAFEELINMATQRAYPSRK